MIRTMVEADIPAVLKFIHQSFSDDPRFNNNQILQLKTHATEKHMQDALKYCYMIVDVDEAGHINGMGGTHMNIVQYLYVDPMMQGQGVGHRILENLESHILASHKFFDKQKAIHVSSTENAVDFYKKHGYEEKETELYKSNGVIIPRFKLKKVIV